MFDMSVHNSHGGWGIIQEKLCKKQNLSDRCTIIYIQTIRSMSGCVTNDFSLGNKQEAMLTKFFGEQ